MAKVIGYTRVSTSYQNLQNQEHEILSYANRKALGQVEFKSVEMSSRKSNEDRKIDELIDELNENDILIVAELSRIGRSVINVIEIINRLIEKKVNIHIIKEDMIINPNNQNSFTTFQINIFASFAQLERDLISARTKEALRAKKEQGVKLGRKKGMKVTSKFDKHKDEIIKQLKIGVTIPKIVENLGVGTRQSLSNYIKNNKLQN